MFLFVDVSDYFIFWSCLIFKVLMALFTFLERTLELVALFLVYTALPFLL